MNTSQVRFIIKKVNNQFGIVVNYGNKDFLVYKDELKIVKQKFMKIVANRELLDPIVNRIESKINTEEVAS